MIQVYLKDVILNGFHGLYNEETTVGGAFKLNIIASYEPINIPILTINETVDYAAILLLVKEKFSQKKLLLETLVTEIAYDIISQFPLVLNVKVSISKLQAPIENFQGEVGVQYELNKSIQ